MTDAPKPPPSTYADEPETATGRHRRMTAMDMCAIDPTLVCPASGEVASKRFVYEANEKLEHFMYGFLKWIGGVFSAVVLGAASFVWAQAVDAGSRGENLAASVRVDLMAHEASSSAVHSKLLDLIQVQAISNAQNNVMLKMLVRDRGLPVPPLSAPDGGP